MLPTRWNDKLAFELALALENSGEPLQDIMERYDLSVNDLVTLKSDAVFLKKVNDYRSEIRAKGLTFRLKARAQAEELLTTSWLLIHDPAVSPTVKADLIKSTVRWAGLEPKKDENSMDTNNNVQIVINLDNTNNENKTNEKLVLEAKPIENQC